MTFGEGARDGDQRTGVGRYARADRCCCCGDSSARVRLLGELLADGSAGNSALWTLT